MSKSPPEIKAQKSHPTEHGYPSEVEEVSQNQTGDEWYGNEELCVLKVYCTFYFHVVSGGK